MQQPSVKLVGAAVAIVILAGVSGCFPSLTATAYRMTALPLDTTVHAVSKLHLHDASVILLHDGFTVHGDTISGTGRRFYIGSADSLVIRRRILRDSAETIVVYDRSASRERTALSLFWGAEGAVALGAMISSWISLAHFPYRFR